MRFEPKTYNLEAFLGYHYIKEITIKRKAKIKTKLDIYREKKTEIQRDRQTASPRMGRYRAPSTAAEDNRWVRQWEKIAITSPFLSFLLLFLLFFRISLVELQISSSIESSPKGSHGFFLHFVLDLSVRSRDCDMFFLCVQFWCNNFVMNDFLSRNRARL